MFAPTQLWVTMSAAGDSECECAHGAEATCPMHHPALPGRRTCAMRGGVPVDSVALTSLLSVDGCLTDRLIVPLDMSASTDAHLSISSPASRFVTPDTRPPRA